MMIRRTLTALLVCLGTAAVEARPAPVIFAGSEIKQCSADTKDREALRQTILTSWDRYLNQDTRGYLETLLPDVTRMSKRAGRLQQGVAQVKDDLPREWTTFERGHGKIREKLAIKEAVVEVTGDAARVTYWIEAEGGARQRSLSSRREFNFRVEHVSLRRKREKKRPAYFTDERDCSIMASTLTLPNLDEELKKWTEEFKKPQGSWQVILYNDPVNSFDNVVMWLQKATGYSQERAAQITKTAHTSGKAVAYGGDKEKCHQVATFLRGKGLQVEVDSTPA